MCKEKAMEQKKIDRINELARKAKSEGKVTVVQTEHSEPRVNDEVGEYVDFKEVKEKK